MESKEKIGIITIIFIITMAPILSFAETNSGKTVFFSDGSGIPGCETTNSCYSPYAVSVGLGETVTWKNEDTFVHTATSGVSGYFGEEDPIGPDGIFDTGMLMTGDSFFHTFNKEGIYNYFCILHPWMTGVVLVDENYSSVPRYVDIQLFIDKESYTEGDTIRVFGTVSDNLETDMSLAVTRPGGKIIYVDQFAVKSDKTFEIQFHIGGNLFDVDGVYSVEVRYGLENMDLVAFEFHQLIQDTIPPLLLIPSDMLVETTDPKGNRVNYSVKAIDGVLESFCNPSSGSMFPIGNTIVTCQSFDNAGNIVQKSFAITIQLDSQSIIIPDWVKEVASFWCNDTINDESFIEAIQYLIENNVISVPLNYDSGGETDQIMPNWIKNNACWWSQNLISDDDFASGLEYLIEQGIITV